MKLRVELTDGDEEVVIRCHRENENVRRMQNVLSALIGEEQSLPLAAGGTEHFVPVADILFFETSDNTVMAHTCEKHYQSTYKLYELEALLPSRFMRVSKSCILDTSRVASIHRSLTGNAEVGFYGTDKTTYVSRMYYQKLHDHIYETRYPNEN